jgi:hypothetical protein
MGGFSFYDQEEQPDDRNTPIPGVGTPVVGSPIQPAAPPSAARSTQSYLDELNAEASRRGVTPEAGWADDLSRIYNGGENAARSVEDVFQSLMGRQAARGAQTNQRIADSQSAQGNALYGSGTGNDSNTPGGGFTMPSWGGSRTGSPLPGFSMPGTQFDDPYTKLLEQIALAQLEEARKPLDTSGFDQLGTFLQSRFNELSTSPGFSPAELALQRTQALEPIEDYRQASKKRATERAAMRGFANPTTGLAELDMRDIDMQADRTRTAADRDLAITGMNQRRGDLSQAMNAAVQLAQLPQQRRASQAGNDSQALNLATLLYQLPAQAQAQALAVINGTAPPSSLLNSVLQMQQQQRQQQQNLWSQIGGLAAGLLG